MLPNGRDRRRQFIDLTMKRHPLEFRWAAAILEEEWSLYRSAMEAVRAEKVPLILGGGFALAAYTGRWRDTKDIDFYIVPGDREKAVDALVQAGFKDYYEQRPYDRNWIHRSIRNDVIVDLIWAMANQRAQVDEIWFKRAPELTLRNQRLLVLPAEEFVWCKLYIIQRDHCDWTDIFNLLYVSGPELDWNHLIWRVGEDLQLLKGLIMTFSWLCPDQAARLPRALWYRLDLSPPGPDLPPPTRDRIRLLDSRHWFAGLEPKGKKLEV